MSITSWRAPLGALLIAGMVVLIAGRESAGIPVSVRTSDVEACLVHSASAACSGVVRMEGLRP